MKMLNGRWIQGCHPDPGSCPKGDLHDWFILDYELEPNGATCDVVEDKVCLKCERKSLAATALKEKRSCKVEENTSRREQALKILNAKEKPLQADRPNRFVWFFRLSDGSNQCTEYQTDGRAQAMTQLTQDYGAEPVDAVRRELTFAEYAGLLRCNYEGYGQLVYSAIQDFFFRNDPRGEELT